MQEADRSADSECRLLCCLPMSCRRLLCCLLMSCCRGLVLVLVLGRAGTWRQQPARARRPAALLARLGRPLPPSGAVPPRRGTAGGFMIQDGIVVIMRGAEIPDGVVI